MSIRRRLQINKITRLIPNGKERLPSAQENATLTMTTFLSISVTAGIRCGNLFEEDKKMVDVRLSLIKFLDPKNSPATPFLG